FTLLVAPALLASMQKRFSQIGFAFVYGWIHGYYDYARRGYQRDD
ncbi:hypothetical protein JHD50_02485, partial [Sulfurimonas sp. MAG313]|nr:hypothetical protein [Sulfurimonas sp. MAG313]